MTVPTYPALVGGDGAGGGGRQGQQRAVVGREEERGRAVRLVPGLCQGMWREGGSQSGG